MTATKKVSAMETGEIAKMMAGSVSHSREEETGAQWIWAGYVGHPEPGDGTAACEELVKRGILGASEPEDGYECYPVLDASALRGTIAGVR